MSITELACPERPDTDINTPIRVCFVCSGNTCRSPMAAAALNHLGKGAYKCASAGLCAAAGEIISQNAVLALSEKGIKSTPENNYEVHRAIETSAELLERFDKIVAISRAHMINLLCSYPQLADKITVMPRDIPDPYMKGAEIYARCLDSIITCLKEMFAV